MKIQTYKEGRKGELVKLHVTIKEEAHKKGLLHLSTHLLITNSSGEIYCRHRGQDEPRYKGLWTTTLGVHLRHGESCAAALAQLLPIPLQLSLLGKFRIKDDVENELCYLYVAKVKKNQQFPSEFRYKRVFLTSTKLSLLFKSRKTTPHLRKAYCILSEKMYKEPLIEIVNKKDSIIGIIPRAKAIVQKESYRLIAVFVFNKKRELFIQKRSMNLKRFPGHFESSAGGHVEVGESYEEAAKRELFEELGIRPKLRFVCKRKIVYDGILRFVSLFDCTTDSNIHIDQKSVQEGKFLSIQKIKEMIQDRSSSTPVFIELFKYYYRLK